VVGPSFSAAEVPDVIEAVLNTYRDLRNAGESFIDTLRRVGMDPFKAAANGARFKVEEAA
jgi:sulfite reductase (NADPH) hemoprotein beta-component